MLEADEVEHDQGVGQVLRVARPALDQLGHADRVGQDQRQGVGIPRRDPPLRGREPGDLGDQDRRGRCRRPASGRSTRASAAAGRPPRRRSGCRGAGGSRRGTSRRGRSPRGRAGPAAPGRGGRRSARSATAVWRYAPRIRSTRSRSAGVAGEELAPRGRPRRESAAGVADAPASVSTAGRGGSFRASLQEHPQGGQQGDDGEGSLHRGSRPQQGLDEPKPPESLPVGQSVVRPAGVKTGVDRWCGRGPSGALGNRPSILRPAAAPVNSVCEFGRVFRSRGTRRPVRLRFDALFPHRHRRRPPRPSEWDRSSGGKIQRIPARSPILSCPEGPALPYQF